MISRPDPSEIIAESPLFRRGMASSIGRLELYIELLEPQDRARARTHLERFIETVARGLEVPRDLVMHGRSAES